MEFVDYYVANYFYRKPRLITHRKGFSREETLMKTLIRIVCICIHEPKCNPSLIWEYLKLD